jgi:putative membrane protein
MATATLPSASKARTTGISPVDRAAKAERPICFASNEPAAFDLYLRLGSPRRVKSNKIMKTKIRIVSQLFILGFVIEAISLTGAIRAADTNVAGEGSSLSDKDKTFMKKAAKGGMMEVAMGQVAEQKAQSEDVKSFGKRMVTDHGKANDELKSIASKKGVQLPSKEHSMKWTSDKAYMDAMVKDHEKDLAEFKEEASSATDPDLKKFADDTAKMVQEHLDLAKETQGKLK